MHALIVTAAIVAVLITAAGGVVMLWHAHNAEPYDAVERGQEQRSAACSRAATGHWRHGPAGARTAASEAENAALRRQLEAPAVPHHNELHLHGVTAREVAELVIRHQEQRRELEGGQQW